MLSIDEIKIIELELVNKCNLSCPLCTRYSDAFINAEKYKNTLNELDINTLVHTLNQFNNLEYIHLVGTVSEPTLFSNLFKLIEYLNSRNIRILISTNASHNNKTFWLHLGELLKKEDEIRFCVDGSTQEIYEKYRVGGKLEKVLSNFEAFTVFSKATTVLQYIEFEHNQDDNIEEIYNMYKFDVLYKIQNESENNTIKIDPKYSKIKNIRDKMNITSTELECFCEGDKFIYINCLGEYLTCCNMYEIHLDEKLPNIYNNTVQEGINHVNKILIGKYNNPVCINSCSKLSNFCKIRKERGNTWS